MEIGHQRLERKIVDALLEYATSLAAPIREGTDVADVPAAVWQVHQLIGTAGGPSNPYLREHALAALQKGGYECVKPVLRDYFTNWAKTHNRNPSDLARLWNNENMFRPGLSDKFRRSIQWLEDYSKLI